jgi:hypothetical protein
VCAKLYARTPVDVLDAAAAFLFVAATASGIALYVASRSSTQTIDEVCTQIRARKAQRGLT